MQTDHSANEEIISTTGILDTQSDFWRAELVIIQVTIARYRRDGDMVRKIAETKMPAMGLLASENLGEDAWGPQIERSIALLEDEIKERDLEKINGASG